MVCKNLKLFEDRHILSLKCVFQGLNILYAFSQFQEKHNIRQPVEEVINKDFSWEFFDGASQGTSTKGGEGGESSIFLCSIVHLSNIVLAKHEITFVN
jgi:hypothetical protein